MKIGKLKLDSPLILAPLAGVNTAAFRLLCKEEGAGLVNTAMLVTHQIVNNPEKIIKRTCFLKDEKPLSIQLAGSDPKLAKEATKIIEDYADVIDLNMGCPEEDILTLKGGSYLIKHPELISNAIKPIIDNTNKPVTAKIRIGWDKDSINTLKVIKILENLGVAAIAIHGRTKAQGYRGQADWSEIKKAKENSNIPIIGNGDVFKPGTAKVMLDQTGCDAVMIGRATLGNPFIFKRTNYLLKHGKNLPETDKKEKLNGFLRFYKYYKKYENIRSFTELRTHAMWFTKGLNGAKRLKEALQKTQSPEEILELYDKALK